MVTLILAEQNQDCLTLELEQYHQGALFFREERAMLEGILQKHQTKLQLLCYHIFLAIFFPLFII